MFILINLWEGMELPQVYEEDNYSDIRLWSASLIVHPKVIDRYNITKEYCKSILVVGSNMFPLNFPIIDEHGISYKFSESYYLAQRFECLDIKEEIAAWRSWKQAKETAYLYQDRMDTWDENRVIYMRNAIKNKFDNNPDLRAQLMNTGEREIIELTYWWDIFFGIDDKSRKGKNILWKLLMEYRSKDTLSL